MSLAVTDNSSVTGESNVPVLKVLVVGQTPPPYHGQALMIERLLQGRFARMQLHHVRMAFSDSIGEVGRFRLSKVCHLLAVVFRIVYFRIVCGADVLYYPPGGPNRVPLYRDLMILNCTRWLFHHTILHFHAGGVSQLYPQLSWPLRWLFRRALFHADAAIRISHGSPPDGQRLKAKQEYIVPNGIEDELPRFSSVSPDSAVQMRTTSQLAEFRVLASSMQAASGPHNLGLATCEPEMLRILFVGMLTEAKGLLVLVEACGILSARGITARLELVGQFQSADFESRLHERIAQLGLQSQIVFRGVLHGDAKWQAFAEADVFCLPTFYEAETFGIVLVEAMSFRLPVVATRWRGIPEIVDDCKSGFLVEPHDAGAIADRLAQLHDDPSLRRWLGAEGRRKFLREFTTEKFWHRMEQVVLDATGQESKL